MNKLTPKQEEFALALLNQPNATAAYRSVYDTSRQKETTQWRNASELANNPLVVARLTELRAEAAKGVIFDARAVLREWIDIATADPNDLTRLRRVACRYCHGVEHEYQWKHPREFAERLAEAMDGNASRRRAKHEPKKLPTDEGGYGYGSHLLPHEDCPDCKGDGVEEVYFADTGKLVGKARKLFAGVKTTKNGIEVMMRDQDAALANIAKSYGMFVEKVKQVDPDDEEGGAQPPLPLDANEAARVYQSLMKADPTNG